MIDLDYKVLKAIFISDVPLKIGDIADVLEMPHSTIGSCVKRLETEGKLRYERYKSVVLSQKGKDIAKELIRHQRLLEVLLYNTLKLTPEEAKSESEKFNLLFSCTTINKICKKFNHPERCPCGEPILEASNCHCKKDLQV